MSVRQTSPNSDFEIETRGPTHRVDIHVNLREGYESLENLSIADVEQECRKWTRDHCMEMTLTPTRLFYPDGEEPTVIIGMILSPRSVRPGTAEGLTLSAVRFAFRLLDALNRERVYVVASDETLVVRKRPKE
jgi:hypothetical protein